MASSGAPVPAYFAALTGKHQRFPAVVDYSQFDIGPHCLDRPLKKRHIGRIVFHQEDPRLHSCSFPHYYLLLALVSIHVFRSLLIVYLLRYPREYILNSLKASFGKLLINYCQSCDAKT